MKIAVIGTGIYGLAIAYSLAKNNYQVMMWTEKESIEKEFLETGKIATIIDKNLPKNIIISSEIEKVLNNANIIYLVCSSKYINNVVELIKPYYKKNIHICIATKGIEDNSKKLISNIIKENLSTTNFSVLSGPTFAKDILNDEPVALAIASKSKKSIILVEKTLKNKNLKLRYNNDIIGVQICGCTKNIIAIASGILSGIGYSNSTQAFLINESIHDIKHIIYALGGRKKTVLSYAGIGDLLLTCTSSNSRNYTFGYIIGKYNDSDKTEIFLKENTVEGYYALKSIYSLLKNKKIDIPLINIIYDIVINHKNPNILINFLIEKE